MTSRMFGSSASSMTMRSMPGAEPPCGGAPNLKALIMPAKLVSTSSLRVAGDLERLVHDVRAVVPDRARAQLDAVADDVVLPGEDVERVLGLQRLQLALRHREGVVAEVDLLLRPRHIRTSGSRRSSRSGTRPARSGRAARRRGCAPRRRAWPPRASLPAAKKMPSSGPRPIASAERVHALLAVVLGDRAAPLAALAGGVAEAGIAFAARPFVHVVEELAALLGGAGRRNGADDAALLDDLRRTGRSPSP